MFGHEKGSFTGALSRRIGKFEESPDATLLLDEISEMDIRLQAKLLRAVQEKEIDRVGGTKPIKVNLRIIATSNKNLQDAIKNGTFREDLFFRLNIINIDLPALSDRKDDITMLSEYFIKKYVQSNGISQKSISNKSLDKMMSYSWPGNVRELENVLHRAVLISDADCIQPEDMHIIEQPSMPADGLYEQHSATETKMVFNTLGYCLGDMGKAANILGVSIDILRKKLAKFTH